MKISGKAKWKKPKRTPSQQALAKAIRPIAKDTATEIKNSVPVVSGALKISVGYKVKSKNGNAYAVIGVKNRYQKVIQSKNLIKTPNLYAMKIEETKHFLERAMTGKEEKLEDACAIALNEILKD